MAALRNYNIGKNINFTFSWKKITFLFLVLSYLTYNYVSPSCKSIENMYQQDKSSNTKINRLLARHEQLRELKHTMLREKLPEKRNMSHNISAYSHVKKNESNNIDLYMKNYKRRYGKKKGLSKLDCYCENKVFRKFNNICDIGKKMQYDQKRSKKFFLKKYAIFLILFALIPALGLICPILFGIREGMPGILGQCLRDSTQNSHFKSNGEHKTDSQFGECDKKWMYDHAHTISKVGDVSNIFSFIMITISLLVVFYILLKIIKYEKIKAGKRKMNIKEYCRFCKDIF